MPRVTMLRVSTRRSAAPTARCTIGRGTALAAAAALLALGQLCGAVRTAQAVEPKATQDAAPKATQDAAPKATQDVAPKATQDVAPKATQDAAPKATKDVAPKATQDAPAATQSAPPSKPSATTRTSGSGASPQPLIGAAAFGDWSRDAPGTVRHIRPSDLPAPRPAARHSPSIKFPAGDFLPKVPAGFEVSRFTGGLSGPRALATAPNGDIFVAESYAGRITILRAAAASPVGTATTPPQNTAFASGLDSPFGIAFYPAGADPQWVYIANSTSVVRFPYRVGDLKPRGSSETIVSSLPGGGHWTRGLAFTRGGKRMLVSVGSASNVAEGQRPQSAEAARRHDAAAHATGAGWGEETRRAAVLSFAPDGSDEKLFATGIRNCVTVAVHPSSGDPWCTTNERDGLGDDLVPDYATRITEGDFFGWPWTYIGDNADPRHVGQRPDLKGKARIPDVLLQAHSAALGLAFYDGAQFPAEHRGHAFVALHGSWNRAKPTGYKVVRVHIGSNGVPTGTYEDFMTGLVASDDTVYGRPVGITVAGDGALLVSDDGNGIIWRIAYRGPK